MYKRVLYFTKGVGTQDYNKGDFVISRATSAVSTVDFGFGKKLFMNNIVLVILI